MNRHSVLLVALPLAALFVGAPARAEEAACPALSKSVETCLSQVPATSKASIESRWKSIEQQMKGAAQPGANPQAQTQMCDRFRGDVKAMLPNCAL